MAPSTYYQPNKGRGHLDLHLLFVVIENCRFNRSPLSTGDCLLKKIDTGRREALSSAVRLDHGGGFGV